MTARARINMETKLASALLALGHVPYDDAKKMSAAQLCSLYHFDHGILHGVEINNEFWNLTPRLISPHREKSRTDTGIVAKIKRLARANDAAVNRLLARDRGEQKPRSKWAGRKIESRGFQRRAQR